MLSIRLIIIAIVAFFSTSWLMPSYWNWSVFNFETAKPINILLATCVILLVILPKLSRYAYKNVSTSVYCCYKFLSKLPCILRYILTGLAIAIVLFMLKSNTYILGDGYNVIGNLIHGVVVSPTALAFVILKFMAKIFSIASTSNAVRLFSSISIVCGVLYLYYLYRILELLITDVEMRLMLFLVASTSALIVLFTGYIETYPIVTAWLAIYIYTSILFIRQKGRFLSFLLIYIIGVFWHLWFIIFLPSFLYVLNKRYCIFPSKIITVSSILYIICIYIAGQIIRRGGYLLSLPFFSTPNSNYTLFSQTHIIDFINELIIVGPVLAILFLVLLFNAMKNHLAPELKLLIYVGLPALFMAFYIDPLIGAVRDWDLLSIFALPFIIMASVLLAKVEAVHKGTKYLIIPILLLNLLHTSSFIINNKNETKSVDRVVQILIDDPHYQKDYYEGKRNKPFATILSEIYGRTDDANKFVKRRSNIEDAGLSDVLSVANSYFNIKDYENAQYYFSLLPDYTQIPVLDRFCFGVSLNQTNRHIKAIEVLKSAMVDTTIGDMYFLLGNSYISINQPDSCKKYYNIAIKHSPDSLRTLSIYIDVLENAKQYDLAIEYINRLLAVFPNSKDLQDKLNDFTNKH